MNDYLIRIKELMKKHGVTASIITSELGISNSTFSDWTRGKGRPKMDTIIKIAEYFDVSLDWLVYGKTNELNDLLLEDSKLLDKYHHLTPDLRRGLMMYIDGLIEGSKSKIEDEYIYTEEMIG